MRGLLAASSAIRFDRAVRDLELDLVALEEVSRSDEDAVPRLREDLLQQVGVEIFEDDRVVETGEELRLHAVVEEIFLPEVVAQREPLADLDAAVVDDHRLVGQLDAARRRGDPLEHLRVERFVRAAAEEEHLAGVEVDDRLARLPVDRLLDLPVDLLALDQGQECLLDVEAGDVGLSADDAGDLVHLVDADGGVLHVGADLFRVGVVAEDPARPVLQADEEAGGVDLTFVGGEGVGVHDHDHAVLL